MAEDRDRPRSCAAPAIRIAFILALGATSLLLVLRPLFTAERRVDVLRDASATLQNGRDTIALFTRLRFHRFPGDGGALVLLEDGRPLARPASGHDAIAALGSGRWSVAGGRAVHFSSSDGTDPLGNGRRYELLYVPDVIRSWPALALFALTAALLFAAGRAGVLSLRGPSSRGTRAGLAALVALALAAGISERWDRVSMFPDSSGYLLHLPIRTAIYPAFVDAFDREPASPREPVDPKLTEQGARREPDGRFTNVARAQKVLTVLALLALFVSLASSLDAWRVAAIFLLGALLDPLWGTSTDAGIWANVETIASEGLNHPLVFLHLALAFATLARFTWPRAVALALVTSLLLLNRPANLPFVLVFPLVAMAYAHREGWRKALLRAGVLALVCAAPLAGECARNRVLHGHAKLHAFSGLATIGISLQTATPDDAEAFDDPRVRELVSACARDPHRIARHRDSPGHAYININMWEIADTLYRRTFGPVDDASWDDAVRRDEVLSLVARRLIARHPLVYLDIVLFHLEGAVDGLTLVTALVLVASLALYRRSRAPELLFLAYATLLPLALLVFTCAIQQPFDRYRSQTWLFEAAALPLLATILAARADAPPEPTP
jgi:hypothetical protein